MLVIQLVFAIAINADIIELSEKRGINMCSNWRIDEKIWGSSNPTMSELRELYQKGFRSIISLLKEDEESPNYDVEEVEEMGFKRYSIPIKDFSPPTKGQFKEFLEVLSEALDRGKVLVHCEGGLGRTGTMAAAYWICKGLFAEEAIQKIRKMNSNAIENREQEMSLIENQAFIASLNICRR